MDPMAASVWGEMVAGVVLWCGGAIAGDNATSPERRGKGPRDLGLARVWHWEQEKTTTNTSRGSGVAEAAQAFAVARFGGRLTPVTVRGRN